MPTREYIEKRFLSKEGEIHRIKNKIRKWEQNPDGRSSRYLPKAYEDLEKAKAIYRELEEQLDEIDRKEHCIKEENVVQFLNKWKQGVLDYYRTNYPLYVEAKRKWYAFCRTHNANLTKMNDIKDEEERKEKRSALRKEYDKTRTEFFTEWEWIYEYSTDNGLNETKLEKRLDKEFSDKYDLIIKQTEKILLRSDEAEDILIGEKGSISGTFTGTYGKVRVSIYGTGGYNQYKVLESGKRGKRFYYRTTITATK